MKLDLLLVFILNTYYIFLCNSRLYVSTLTFLLFKGYLKRTSQCLYRMCCLRLTNGQHTKLVFDSFNFVLITFILE